MKRSIYTLVFLSSLILGCENEEMSNSVTKLDYYIESYNLDGLGFTPQLKVAYQYKVGKLSRYIVSSYDPTSQAIVEQRHFDFSYVAGQVSGIKGYQAGATDYYISYSYQYLPDNRVLKISENNIGTGINSEANFTYNDSDESVKVAYSFSNGGSFEYEIFYNNKNIANDKTTRGSQLCNDGVYTYDEHKDPFNELGYVDYFLSNLSANNKLTEDINYVGCAFPTLIPESYTYEYNDLGYPTVSTTFFSSGGKSEKQFFYK